MIDQFSNFFLDLKEENYLKKERKKSRISYVPRLMIDHVYPI